MTRESTAAAIVVAIAATIILLLLPTPGAAQNTVVSLVPKDPCCFNNFRFSGTCVVQPRQGQLCGDILSYLNNLSSSGENYCSSTFIRGGWTSVDCASGDASAPVGTMKKTPVEVTEPSSARPALPGTVPRAATPSELRASDANVIQVRLETPIEGESPTAGQQLTGRVENDILGPDGEVLLPAGSTIDATFGDRNTWSATPTGELRLVGTTTSAADLFGTAEDDATKTADAATSLHVSGDLVEVSEGSVVSFELTDISQQPADLRVLATATDVWMRAFNEHDATTIAGLSSPDGALLPPDGKAVIGRDAIYDYWTEVLSNASARIELEDVETVVEGDLGYKAGRFVLVDTDSGTTKDNGKYIQIWKRSHMGYWELHRDMWNSSATKN
ncbi:MAG: nuclear transport factor 2 family protein [Thermoanaerobaculales bacterium]|jgi:uncharacterized protein (TIGR02246 family)|nr:nuclear transport factor 2 family protein [Thermoanaerobaculales bacterium]